MSSVYTIGESLVDLIFKNNQPVSAKAGGSMLNTSISLGRLGVPVHFISDFGNDQIGMLIESFLENNNVHTELIEKSDRRKSSLALAFLNENNDANYSFYKDIPEKRLAKTEVDFKENDILLFGSYYALEDSVREALIRIVSRAQDQGAIIIYDPNFRKPHKSQLKQVKSRIIENISYADIVRGSDEDFQMIFGLKSPSEAFVEINKAGCKNLIYTANKKGVMIKTPKLSLNLHTEEISPVSTIGAGDNFNAGIVWTLLKEGISKSKLSDLSESLWDKIGKNGIDFASDVCMSYDNYISKEFAEKFK